MLIIVLCFIYSYDDTSMNAVSLILSGLADSVIRESAIYVAPSPSRKRYYNHHISNNYDYILGMYLHVSNGRFVRWFLYEIFHLPAGE